MKTSQKRDESDPVMIDIEQIRREYHPLKNRQSSSRTRPDTTEAWSLNRTMKNLQLWHLWDRVKILPGRQTGHVEPSLKQGSHKVRPQEFKTTVKNLPQRPAGALGARLQSDQSSAGNAWKKSMKNSPGRLAGILGSLLKTESHKMRPQEFDNTMKNSPSRTMLPHFLVVPWWMVFVVLGATAVVSVSYSEGEEHAVTQETSQEKQDVEALETDVEPTEEGSLIQQLQHRLKELEAREQRLQQREHRIEGLQRDVEALAARQAKEAERLQKRATELEAKSTDKKKDDPSLRHLVKVYNAMDPEEAALRIEKMDEHLALEILSGIKDKKAAVVLAGVNPQKAATLSQGLRNFSSMKKGSSSNQQ